MTPTIYDNILIVCYLLAWICLFAFIHYRKRHLDAFSVIVASYIVYATVSVFSLNDELFNTTYEHLTLFPFIYLFAMLVIALMPSLSFHNNPVSRIEPNNSRVINILLWTAVLCSVLLVPMIAKNFNEGIVKLLTDTDAGKDAYTENLGNASEAGKSASNIPAIFFNAFYDIIVFFFFYLLTLKKKTILLTLGLGFSIIIGWMLPIMAGQRGGVIIAISTAVVTYFLFRQYIKKTITRIIEITGLTFVIITFVPIMAITSSRFGETNAGVVGYLNWYIGQGNIYFNNYAMDAGGIRYGDRTLNLFKRVIDSSTPANFAERRFKYRNLDIDDYYFTTFVGDFCLDFGPIIAFLIFAVFNIYILASIKPRDGTIRLDQMLLLYFTICVCMQGGMALFAYSDTGNLRIICLFALVFYLQLHNKLLEKFPKATSDEKS